jgi:hypothetical protein
MDDLKRKFPFWWPVRSLLPLAGGESVWIYGHIVNWEIGHDGVKRVKIQTDPWKHEAKLWVLADATESVTIPGSGRLSNETYFPEVKR